MSDLGGQISVVALPCAVVLALGASALQTALVGAVETAVIPLLALPAGVLVDRTRRRPLMIAANVLRLAALATIPVAAALHALTLAQVLVVAAITGAAGVLFDTAYQAFVPVLVGRDGLVEGNERMQVGASAAEVVGNGLAGGLVNVLGAPLAVGLNAVAYVVATCALLRIRCVETPPIRVAGASWRAEIRAGWSVVLRDPVLRAIGFANAVAHFGGGTIGAVFFVYLLRESHLGPVAVGIVLAAGNAGALGAACAGRIARRFGVRTTLTGAMLLAGGGELVVPLFAHAAPFAAVIAMRLAVTLAGPIFDVTQQTVRVERTPPALHGRMNATLRTIVWGALPLGALAGGLLATHAGTFAAFATGGVATLASLGLLLALPARAYGSHDGVADRLETAVVGERRRAGGEADDEIPFRAQFQAVA